MKKTRKDDNLEFLLESLQKETNWKNQGPSLSKDSNRNSRFFKKTFLLKKNKTFVFWYIFVRIPIRIPDFLKNETSGTT